MKALVLLSNILKTHVPSRSVSSSLRTNVVTLTQSTEDFAILLPISSISSYSNSPTFSNSYNGNSRTHEDIQLPPSLSRSRSEQPPIRLARQSPAPSNGGPASSFNGKTAVTKRLRLPRESSNEKADPG